MFYSSEEPLLKVFFSHKHCIFYLENGGVYYKVRNVSWPDIDKYPGNHPVKSSCRFWECSLKGFSKVRSFIYAAFMYKDCSYLPTSHFN